MSQRQFSSKTFTQTPVHIHTYQHNQKCFPPGSESRESPEMKSEKLRSFTYLIDEVTVEIMSLSRATRNIATKMDAMIKKSLMPEGYSCPSGASDMIFSSCWGGLPCIGILFSPSSCVPLLFSKMPIVKFSFVFWFGVNSRDS